MHVSVCASGLKYVISVYVCCVCVCVSIRVGDHF